MTDDTFTCDRCGQQFPRNQLKEVFYEEGPQKERRKMQVDPSCLDQIMNESEKVRGVGGDEKRAAIHVVPGEGGDGGDTGGERESFGERPT